MRLVPFIAAAAVTTALVFALNKPWGTVPPMGAFISPQHGFWQNAEPVSKSYSMDLNFATLKGKVEVFFDDRLVPHVFATNDEDLYFVQGYLHAKFRLFQMDLQTKAAAGRASEIAGAKAIRFDKEQRRLGMVYAAENAVKEIEKDASTKILFDAYTNGINTYIDNLKAADLPLEYKLLNIKPDRWSNLRTALHLKMMAKMLSSGTESDLAYTNAKATLLPDELKMLYPQVPDSLMPIVPKGTAFAAPGIVPVAPANMDSAYLGNKTPVIAGERYTPNENNGSNNWVVAGSKTKSGAPILCNDPHLELSLPSIWYEMQLKTPNSNSYGVSLPGAPFIIIGFNDSIAWGVTNSQRDVKDYYEIKFKDKTKQEYWFNNQWTKATVKQERFKVKGEADVLDTVAYTVFGPVMYDESFTDSINAGNRNLAVRWTAHDPSNEGITFYKLNRAKNYIEYLTAIETFQCPGQNFVFASKTGDIALWQQGKFPARWEQQGMYIMPGQDSSYMWQGFIPQAENPHALNPTLGFLQSANQRAADATYPYFIPGSYITARGITIHNMLNNMSSITPEDMMKLQNNYFNTTAEDLRPIILTYLNEQQLNAKEKEYLSLFKNWDLMASPDSKGQTIFRECLNNLYEAIWDDEYAAIKPKPAKPNEQTLLELLKKDTSFRFIDNINTPNKETIYDIITTAFQKAATALSIKEKEGKLVWSKYNNPSVYHLIKDLKPFAKQGLYVGGDNNIVNAIKGSHGPSWRMVVQLSNTIEAYGVYPGGQSGNPGSKFYENFVDGWAAGKYNKLWYMQEADKSDKNVKWVMKFNK